MFSTKKALLALLAALILFFAGQHAYSTSTEDQAESLAFFIAHKQDNAENTALIQQFADTVHERTDGKVTITLHVPNYPNEANGTADTALRTLNDLSNSNAFMAQVSVKRFADLYPDLCPFNALDAPDVFRNHEHAARVLDGDVGQDLLAVVHDGSHGLLHGFDFTYSGGYRNIFSTVPIYSLADLSGLTMRAVSPMSHGVIDGLGIKILDDIEYRTPKWRHAMADNSIVLEEAENLRIDYYRHAEPDVIAQMDTVIETNHNLFLTLLVANTVLFESLTAKQQQIITEEARSLALAERELSIQQAEETKRYFEDRGVTFLPLTDNESAKLKEISASARAEYEDTLGEWFDRIAATK